MCVHALVQSLADRVAQAQGAPSVDVPDLGPAVVMDQLRVLVFDASAAGLSDGLAEELAALRGTLRVRSGIRPRQLPAPRAGIPATRGQ